MSTKALRIVAAALGRRLGITVHVDPMAPTAYTDGKRVVLPVLPLAGPEEEEDLFLGLVAHESFHIRFTYLKGAYNGAPPDGVQATPFIKGVENVLEDARIEKLGFAKYRGVRKILEKLVAYAIRDGWFPDAPKAETKPGELASFALLFHYRANFLGQHDLDTAAKNWGAEARSAFGSAVWDQVLALADKAVVAQSCHALDGTWHAAQQISDLLQQAGESRQEQDDQQDHDGQDDQDGQKDEGGSGSYQGDQAQGQDSDGPGSNQDDQNDQSGQGQSGDHDDQDNESQGQDSGQGSGNGKGGNPFDLTPEQAKNCREAVVGGEDDVGKTDLADIAGDALKKMVQASGHADDDITVTEPLQKVRHASSVREAAGTLYRRICGPIEAKLWAKAQEEVFTARVGTAGIVPTALHQAGTTGKIFARRLEGESRNMAVKILLDLSGSMGSAKDPEHAANTVSAAAMALAKLFSALGIEYSVSWFGSFYATGRAFSSAPLRENEGWHLSGMGGTCLAQAMNIAGTELAYQEHDKRLLIVLTDGDADAVVTKATDEALRQDGVDVRYVLLGGAGAEIVAFAGARAGSAPTCQAAKALIDAFRVAL